MSDFTKESVGETRWIGEKWHDVTGGKTRSEIVFTHEFLAKEAHAEGWTIAVCEVKEVWEPGDLAPKYVQSLHGITAGQEWTTQLGTRYTVQAVEKSGYVTMTSKQFDPKSGLTKDKPSRVWCDVVLGWEKTKEAA